METADGSNPTSRLLLEHVDSVFIFHFQLLREGQLFWGPLGSGSAYPCVFLPVSFTGLLGKSSCDKNRLSKMAAAVSLPHFVS